MKYTPGERVELIATTDPYTRLRPGDCGTVQDIDDAGTVHIHWDSGSHLGMLTDDGDVIRRIKS